MRKYSRTWTPRQTGVARDNYIKCLYCGKEFYSKPYQRKKGNAKYCSQECYGLYNKGRYTMENHPRYSRKKKICPICKKEFYVKKSHFKRLRCCSKKCMAERYEITVKGEGNPNWQGGISKMPYPFNFNNELKELIRKRDNYTCQYPDCNRKEEQNRRKLDIHHIDYDKKNINPNNLISLCTTHNPKVNFNRKYWQKYFKNYMEKRNEKIYGMAKQETTGRKR